MVSEEKETLQHYLQGARDTLAWKVEGLSERELRLPRTPTGLSLLGLVKHALNTEALYFGPVFGRAWPTPHEVVSDEDLARDPQADWYATEQETPDVILDRYRRVQAFADETIAALPVDAVGRVAHWGGEEVTLHRILVHVVVDLQRHAGHADILREQVDGSAGLLRHVSNLPAGTDWAAYTARLTAIADRSPD